MSTTHFGGRVDNVRLEAEEEGYELVVETDLGVYRFNAHAMVCDESLVTKLSVIQAEAITYLDEGRRAAREHSVDLAKQVSDAEHDRLVGDV